MDTRVKMCQLGRRRRLRGVQQKRLVTEIKQASQHLAPGQPPAVRHGNRCGRLPAHFHAYFSTKPRLNAPALIVLIALIDLLLSNRGGFAVFYADHQSMKTSTFSCNLQDQMFFASFEVWIASWVFILEAIFIIFSFSIFGNILVIFSLNNLMFHSSFSCREFVLLFNYQPQCFLT